MNEILNSLMKEKQIQNFFFKNDILNLILDFRSMKKRKIENDNRFAKNQYSIVFERLFIFKTKHYFIFF